VLHPLNIHDFGLQLSLLASSHAQRGRVSEQLSEDISAAEDIWAFTVRI
jgi:hypothetical protein